MLVEDTTLLYSIDHPDPENNFTVTVVPINEAGAGQIVIIFLLISSKMCLNSVNTSMSSLSSSFEFWLNDYPDNINNCIITNNIHVLHFACFDSYTTIGQVQWCIVETAKK